MSRAEYDVAIVGGGPAGATLAIRLARLGHSVVVFERSAFARGSAGESLHPGIWPLFESLDIHAIDGLRVHRSLVRWSGDDVVERQLRVPSLSVIRPSFDRYLLDLARTAGATVLQPAPADDAICDAAKIVIDASGRANWSRTMASDARTRTSERTIAIRGMWRGPGLPQETRVEALEDGWIWGAPMPDGSFAAMACVDAASPANTERYVEMMQASQLFRDLPGTPIVHCHDATTYAADIICTDRLIRIGDASHTLDPLSSAGVRSAMQSALHSSIAINTILRFPDRSDLARTFLEDARQAAVTEHQQWTRNFYAESRWQGSPFWQKRAVAASTGTRMPVPLEAHTPIALAEGITIADVPCVVDDLVEPRRGVTGSQLPRPFVWLGGIEVVMLLAPLEGHSMNAAALLAHWRDLAPHGKEPAILDALLRSGVLTASCLSASH